MSENSKREFLAASVSLVAGSLALSSTSLLASSHEHKHGEFDDGLEIKASTKDTCATCQYWGGMRKASKDKKMVTAQSMGWCNNPDSMNYQALTPADHKMTKTGVWKKWGAL